MLAAGWLIDITPLMLQCSKVEYNTYYILPLQGYNRVQYSTVQCIIDITPPRLSSNGIGPLTPQTNLRPIMSLLQNQTTSYGMNLKLMKATVAFLNKNSMKYLVFGKSTVYQFGEQNE